MPCLAIDRVIVGGFCDDAHVKDHTRADEVHAPRIHEAGGQEVKARSQQPPTASTPARFLPVGDSIHPFDSLANNKYIN